MILLEKGFPYSEIQELELSEFEDWKEAARALDIDRKLAGMNISLYPYKSNQQRNADFNRIKNEQMMALGKNPYFVDQDEIRKTKQRLKKAGKVKKIGGNERNLSETKT